MRMMLLHDGDDGDADDDDANYCDANVFVVTMVMWR